MYHYERSYQAARGLGSFLEVVGWLVVFLGALMAIVTLATGGALGGNGMSLRGPAVLILAVPGVLTAVSGLVIVLYSQSARANVDTAEMTRELLRLARGEKGASLVDSDPQPSSEVIGAAPEYRSGEPEEIEHLGYTIRVTGRQYGPDGRAIDTMTQYVVDGQKFFRLNAAQEHVRRIVEG